MFYGLPEDRHAEFQQAVKTLQSIYPDLYAADMLICMWRNRSFMQDQAFVDSFMQSIEHESEQSLVWRLHTLAWAASNALYVPGDFVECGVLKGFCSRVLCQYLGFEKIDRRFYLYDTFYGLPESTSTADERQRWDYSQFDADQLHREVSQAFSAYPNVEVVRGIVPDVFAQTVPDKIAYLHIDMNSVQAEVLALEALFDRVVPGGFIVLDDFGWACNRDQMVAELEFFQQRNHKVLELPTGQGLVLKHA